MSESEDKKELAGLARSVEALFGPREPAPASGTGPTAPPIPESPVAPGSDAGQPQPRVDDDFMGGFDTGIEAPDPTPAAAPESDDRGAPDLDFAFEPDPAFPAGDDPAGDHPVGDDPVGGDPVGGDPAGDDPDGGDPAGDDPDGGDPDVAPDAGIASVADPVMDFLTEPVTELDDLAPAEPGDLGGTGHSDLPGAEDGQHAEPLLEAVADFAFEADPAFPGEAAPDFPHPTAAVSEAPDAVDTAPVDLGLRPRSADDGDEEEEPPTPMDLAVDAYLAGDGTRAHEIQRLADDLVERKEVEPIARSVARLVHAAGTPPDPTIYRLAESIMSPVVLGRLARRIGAERDEARRNAYFTVCTSIGRDMAEALRNELADSTDRLSRRIHYDALVAMGDASRPVIEEMVADDNRFLVRNAVSILGDTGGDNAVDLVTSALANPDSRVRREALFSLAKLGDEEAGQLVPGFLDDPDIEVRRAAVVAAGELRVERALRSLIAQLDATLDPDDVIPLLRALGQLGDPGAVVSIEKHAVRPLFSKPRTAVRIAAYRALAAMGTPQARRLLNQALSDKDPEVKAAVKDVLHMR